NDAIFGNNGANSLFGGAGTDLLVGGGGNDTLDGGTVGNSISTDWVSYRGATGDGVNVDLGAGTATPRTTSNIGSDTLLNIDGVIGSNFADSLVGGSSSTDFRGVKTEWFQGGIGNDTLDGGWTDTGTAGMDAGDLEYNWARYDGVAGAVTINLSTNTASSDGEGGSDTLSDINAVWGGIAGDNMTGGNTDFNYIEIFNGGAGSDIIDGGSGTDAALYRNSTSAISITLASGSGGGSDGLGGTDSLTGIEMVVGSDYNDTITGGAGDQSFQGRKGADSLDGGADTDTVDYNGDYDSNSDGFGVQVNLSSTATSGNWRGVAFSVAANQGVDGWGTIDTLANFENILGSIYNDVLAGTDGNNSIRGNRGDDLIGGRGGNDILDGGDGTDMASYRFATGPVQVDLGTNLASDGSGGTDTLISIEQVRGSDFGDTLTGDETHVNTFLTSFSAQLFEGGAGNDTIDGGDSRPGLVAVASYSSALSGVTVNLGQGWATDGLGGQDTLRNIGFVTGSGFNDSLVGGGRSAQVISSNLFESFEGGAGNDTIDGGAGADRVVYSGGAINANLATGLVLDGYGTTDTLSGIEQVRGSMAHDILTGNSAGNAFEGRGGNDTINGAGGTDTIRFDQSPTAIAIQFTGVGSGTAFDGYGSVDSFTSIESVRGSDHNDTMLGGSGNETFEGMAGNDSIVGGGGTDTVSYGSSIAGIAVTLVAGAGSVTDSWGGTDILSGIRNILGSQFGDTIVGDTAANIINALDGNDTITGGQGNDSIEGGFGFDVARFSGDISDYTISPTGGGGYTVTHNISGEIDSLLGVEQLQFDTGGPQTNAISYTWSLLPNGAAFYFNPALDFLYIDGGLSATDIDFSPIEEGPDAGRGAQFTQWNEATGQPLKQISLLFTPGDDPLNLFKLTSSHVTFANGSVLKLGDDLLTTADDDSSATLTGDGGNDVLVTTGGSQTLNGQGGDDFLVTVTRQSGTGSSGTDVFNGGDGNDWLGLDAEQGGLITQYTVNLASGGSITTTGNSHDSFFTVSGIENVEGSDVADHITGDSGNNRLYGWDGNDTVVGSAGNDSIIGGQGSDSIDGGTGRDLLDYSQDG
ncbi:MAG: hypothetical protein JNK59_10740, partial [Sterolibacteriaceae bacterium]|nr:hypothetical protein [Sterolibacteriaceae bacterium]